MDAELIRLIRINAGMNQLQFANHIEENRSQLALVEAGYRNPSEKMVEAIRGKFDAGYIELVEAIAEAEKLTPVE